MIKLVIIFVVLIVGILIFNNLGLQDYVVDDADSTNDQLWVMIKIDEYFRSDKDLKVEEDVIALVEKLDLGEVDGHSSGVHQFDFNFYDIKDYEKAKKEISEFIKANYPKLSFVISEEYETTFDQVEG